LNTKTDSGYPLTLALSPGGARELFFPPKPSLEEISKEPLSPPWERDGVRGI